MSGLTLFEFDLDDMVPEDERLPIIETDWSRMKCAWCGDPITEPWAAGPKYCEIIHPPLRDGWCGHMWNHHWRVVSARRALADGPDDRTRGNCFAVAHMHDKNPHPEKGNWFGYGKVPDECLKQEIQEHTDWLEAHGIEVSS